jgi:nucleotide-binding universal stress UspA family protein
MATSKESPASGRIVLVVGVDLTDISEQLLATAKDLVRYALEAEIHVVHVVAPESLAMRLEEPVGSVGIADRAHVESAQFLLRRLRDSVLGPANLRVIVHTPVGAATRELTRIARDVNADVLVVEAHDHKRPPWSLHRSVTGRLAKTAPCSVLAVRRRKPAAAAQPRPALAT